MEHVFRIVLCSKPFNNCKIIFPASSPSEVGEFSLFSYWANSMWIGFFLFALGTQLSPFRVEQSGNDLVIPMDHLPANTRLFEVSPYEDPTNSRGKQLSIPPGTKNALRIPASGRENHGFYFEDIQGKRLGQTTFVTKWDKSKDPEWGLPKNGGIKGLQVQMFDDALALGIHHAALNLNLSQLVRLPAREGDDTLKVGETTLGFRHETFEALPIKSYTDQGIRVYLILLAYQSGNTDLDRLLLHPKMRVDAPNRLGAFNTTTANGVLVYEWILTQLAKRQAHPEGKFGRVAGWIVGNEVNAHDEWYNRGPATVDEVVGDYHRALRLAHGVLAGSGGPGRIFASFEHHWTMRPGTNPKRSIPGKEFLLKLLTLSKLHGDFPWHIAYHPYPENLFEPRSWLDKLAKNSPDSPKITFKNLDQLASWMNRPETLFQGKPRRIILSEQGFHSPEGPKGQTQQAQGYVFAFERTKSIPQIDAFILHRHVDHAKEGGLSLGLWTNLPGQICSPHQKKLLWQVFHDAGTANEEPTFAPYRLPNPNPGTSPK